MLTTLRWPRRPRDDKQWQIWLSKSRTWVRVRLKCTKNTPIYPNGPLQRELKCLILRSDDATEAPLGILWKAGSLGFESSLPLCKWPFGRHQSYESLSSTCCPNCHHMLLRPCSVSTCLWLCPFSKPRIGPSGHDRPVHSAASLLLPASSRCRMCVPCSKIVSPEQAPQKDVTHKSHTLHQGRAYSPLAPNTTLASL